MRLHGKAEISSIQRQRTDFEPLLDWLQKNGHGKASITPERAQALRSMPEDARMSAMEDLCAADPKLARGFARWRARFDYEWMREAVEMFATGSAQEALELLDQKGRLKLMSGPAQAMGELISAWDADKTAVDRKTIIAATRAEVAQLNAMARAALISKGLIDDARGIEAEIIHRDESTDTKRFAPGDRIVFTMNDKELGVANGVAGLIREIDMSGYGPVLAVELDDVNELGESVVRIPVAFARFDHALFRAANSIRVCWSGDSQLNPSSTNVTFHGLTS